MRKDLPKIVTERRWNGPEGEVDLREETKLLRRRAWMFRRVKVKLEIGGSQSLKHKGVLRGTVDILKK